MAKKSLDNRLLGMVATKVATLKVLNDCSLDEAFNTYCKSLPQSNSKFVEYDLEGKKAEIIANANDKLPKKKRETIAKIESPKTTTVAKVGLPVSDKKKKYVPPMILKVKGEIEVDPTEEGVLFQKTENTKKIKMKCPPNSKGVLVGEKKDRAGCEILDLDL